jgi:hypothetical protein
VSGERGAQKPVFGSDGKILYAPQSVKGSFTGFGPDIREHTDEGKAIRNAIVSDEPDALGRKRPDIGVAPLESPLPVFAPALMAVNDANVESLPRHENSIVGSLRRQSVSGQRGG